MFSLLYCAAQGRRYRASLLSATADALTLYWGQLFSIHTTRANSPMLPRQGAGPALPSTWTSTWPKVVAQASDIPMAFGVNSGHRHQHTLAAVVSHNQTWFLSAAWGPDITMAPCGGTVSSYLPVSNYYPVPTLSTEHELLSSTLLSSEYSLFSLFLSCPSHIHSL